MKRFGVQIPLASSNYILNYKKYSKSHKLNSYIVGPMNNNKKKKKKKKKKKLHFKPYSLEGLTN
jgi:hypothetical protein